MLISTINADGILPKTCHLKLACLKTKIKLRRIWVYRVLPSKGIAACSFHLQAANI